MPLQSDKFYTMIVHLHRHYSNDGKMEQQPEQFKDMTYEQVVTKMKTIWTTGILIQHTPISFESIDPLHIKQVFFVEQPTKFAL